MSGERESIILSHGMMVGYCCKVGTGFYGLLESYHKSGVLSTALSPPYTTAQKKALCKLVDTVHGDVFLDWDEKFTTKEDAKRYIREYRNGGGVF